MAKIRLTKTELKLKRDALKRFRRYLPTLQLKKQQLQLEARQAREVMARLDQDIVAIRESLDGWISLLDDQGAVQVQDLVVVEQWEIGSRNIAGVDTPTFEGIQFRETRYDLFATPVWFDDVVAAQRELVQKMLHRELVAEQVELLEQELRVVTQRVNLFEKVKIPEAEADIRRIRIHLGDQQTNAVGRAKIAKAKCRARDEAMAAAMGGFSADIDATVRG